VQFIRKAQRYSAPLSLSASTLVKARTLSSTNWSAITEGTFQFEQLGTPIRITEIMYNPPGGDAYEFIELQNIGASAIDLGGYTFEGITYRFPDDDQLLAPGARLVLSSSVNPAAFAQRYPQLRVSGRFTGALNNGGESIILRDRLERVVAMVDYSDENGWPSAADGAGYSLELIDANADSGAPSNWQASAQPEARRAQPTVLVLEPQSDSTKLSLPVRSRTQRERPIGLNFKIPAMPLWILRAGVSQTIPIRGGLFFPQGHPFLQMAFSLSGATVRRISQVCTLDLDSMPARGPSSFTTKIRTESMPSPMASRFQHIRPDEEQMERGRSICRLLTLQMKRSHSAPLWCLMRSFQIQFRAKTTGWRFIIRTPNLPAAIGGFYLSISNQYSRLPELSFISPAGYVQILADENYGSDHINFKLPASGATLILSDDSGAELNRFAYGVMREGVSYGRLPNGSEGLTEFPASSSPGRANYLPNINTVQISEVLVSGTAGDWVEIYNPLSSIVDLSGMSIAVGDPVPKQWQFAAGTTLSPGAFLLVKCDDKQLVTNVAPAFNVGESLNEKGDAIFLFDRFGQVSDFVKWGAQLPNQSIGRSGSVWTLLSTPTPGAPNSLPAALGDPGLVRINEWMAAPLGGDDWFELYNPQNSPVDLGGLYLTDDPSVSGRTNSQIAQLTFVAPSGFILLQADDEIDKGPEHVGFSLDTFGETLRLYNNTVIVDEVTLLLQAPSVSQGRMPDGGPNIVSFPGLATPNGPNASTSGDADSDGLPDDWERAHGLNEGNPADALLDFRRRWHVQPERVPRWNTSEQRRERPDADGGHRQFRLAAPAFSRCCQQDLFHSRGRLPPGNSGLEPSRGHPGGNRPGRSIVG
jgi:hypothetical protein